MSQDLFSIPQVAEESAPGELLPLERMAETAERQIQALKRVMLAALSMTNHHDWCILGGRPYLTGSGAEKIARLFGISWYDFKIEESRYEDDKGPYIVYTVTGKFRMGPSEIEAVGTCSTRSAFFGKAGGEFKPLSEVDIPSVKKAAVTNCIVNGVKRMLGIRSVTLEALKAAGVKVELIPRVEYKKKGGTHGNHS